MLRPLAVAIFLVSLGSVPALALDMPARKPGLWEIKMDFVGRKIPAQTMQHCIDAATDKLMNAQFGGAAQDACSKQEVMHSGATMIVDSVCKFSEATTTSHAVVTGSFDSAYTVDVTSTRTGGPPMPGMPASGSTHMTIAGKWLGPCITGQKPGDIIMANGMKMNVLDMPHAPPRKP